MMRTFSLLAVLWLTLTPGCGGTAKKTDGGVDGGGIDGGGADGGGSDAGCKGDLAGTELQICGMPDASFNAKTCQCQGDP